jgi:acetoin utilization deacetylase AcuC-like enzyme
VHVDPTVDYPFYAGYADETGVGAAEGTNCNVPLRPGIDEEQYLLALDLLLARLVAFGPHWLIVSAGFDTYIHDRIGTFQVTTSGFCDIGRRLGELAIPTLVVQEGGYCIADLGRNVVAFLRGLVCLCLLVFLLWRCLSLTFGFFRGLFQLDLWGVFG